MLLLYPLWPFFASILGFIHAHLYEYPLEVSEAKSYTRFHSAERNLHSLGNFCMSPSLKISKLDNQSLFNGNLHECRSNMRTYNGLPGFIPGIGRGEALV